MSIERRRRGRFARLTSLDRMFLHLETPDWPGHFGGLAVVQGKALVDDAGQLPMAEIRERIDRLSRRYPPTAKTSPLSRPFGRQTTLGCRPAVRHTESRP